MLRAMTSLHEDPRVRRGMERQLELRRRALEDGARPLGWKLGLGTPAAMEKLGTSAPLVGFLTDRSVVDGECSIGGWGKPTAEPEVAIHLAADVPGGAGAEEAAAAIGGLGAAVEVVDIGDASDVEEILAGDIFHRHVVLGPAGAGDVAARRAAARRGRSEGGRRPVRADRRTGDGRRARGGPPRRVRRDAARRRADHRRLDRARRSRSLPATPCATGWSRPAS